MKNWSLLLSACLVTSLAIGQETYDLKLNSWQYDGIPKGKVTKHTWESTIFANTIREYYVYVPDQYDSSSPAALMIFQDGHAYVDSTGSFRVPTVFDNLISQGKMPVTIGLFINPGHEASKGTIQSPFNASNRSFEYDEVSNTYGRFLLEELIPELEKSHSISSDPSMRAISGLSSGGICAFTAAWFFPDQFQKVLSHIGSFTDIRGGHNFPSMIRKNPKKNIKVFLQDGSNDLNNQYGDWWLANLQMKSALEYKSYDMKFEAGTGNHSGNHGGAILPESLTWLWKETVPNRVEEGVLTYKEDSVMASGETPHFASMQLATNTLKSSDEQKLITNTDKEQILIIKTGELKVGLGNKTQTLGPNSVVVVLPGDKAEIKSISETTTYYQMEYVSRKPRDDKRGRKMGGSYVVDFDEVEFQPHDRGGIRNYFNKSTAMCPYYEMHITNLNAGIKSHEPHVHRASEMVVMVAGETEMEIGNEIYRAKPGDIYYLPSNVPHAIKNTGDQQAMYFAYQWE